MMRISELSRKIKSDMESLNSSPKKPQDTLSPRVWLEEFNQCFAKTEIKVGGHKVDFDQGMQSFLSLLKSIKSKDKSVWWIGNGGSLALCSHLSQDCMNKLGLKSIAFNDPSLLTCMANDFGYENVYSRPLDANASEGDLLVAISSSGNSENILNAIRTAKEKKLKIVSLSSFKPSNKIWNTETDINIYLPSERYGHAEVGHEALIHSVIESAIGQF